MLSYLTTIATVIIILVTDTQWYITTNHFVREGGHHICNSILNIRKGCHFLNRGHHYISHGYHHKRHKNNLGTNLGTHPQRACVYFLIAQKLRKWLLQRKQCQQLSLDRSTHFWPRSVKGAYKVLNKYYVLTEKWASTKKSPRRWREGVISYFLEREGVTRNENGREDMTEKKGVMGAWPGKIGGDGVIAKKIWRNGVSA